MKHYDPETAPNPEEWLKLDERERIQLAERCHRKARVKIPSVEAHAIFHAIVENQIAEGHAPVARAMQRLAREGLSRHEALHAIGSLVADYIYDVMNTNDRSLADTAQARYDAAVERITVKEWRRKYEEE